MNRSDPFGVAFSTRRFPRESLRTSCNRRFRFLTRNSAPDPSFHFGKLIQRLQRSIKPSELQLTPVLSRIRHLKKQDAAALLPDPIDALARKPAVADATRPASVPEIVGDSRLIVFNRLLGTIAAGIARRGQQHAADFCSHFANQEDLPLAADTIASLTAWAAAPGSEPRISGTNADLQKIINAAFVWSCEKFGPVDADKLIVRAIATCEQLPQADDCSPRLFL